MCGRDPEMGIIYPFRIDSRHKACGLVPIGKCPECHVPLKHRISIVEEFQIGARAKPQLELANRLTVYDECQIGTRRKSYVSLARQYYVFRLKKG